MKEKLIILYRLFFLLVLCIVFYKIGHFHGFVSTGLDFNKIDAVCIDAFEGLYLNDTCFLYEGELGLKVGRSTVFLGADYAGLFEKSLIFSVSGLWPRDYNATGLFEPETKIIRQHELFKTDEQKRLGKMQSSIGDKQ